MFVWGLIVLVHQYHTLKYISIPDDTVLCGIEYQQYFVFYLIPYRLFYCQMVWTHGHTGWTGPGCQSYTTYLLNGFSNWELKGLKVISYLALMGAYDRVRPQIFVYWVEWDCNESTNTDPDPTRWPRYGSQWIDIAKLLKKNLFFLILKIEIWFLLSISF